MRCFKNRSVAFEQAWVPDITSFHQGNRSPEKKKLTCFDVFMMARSVVKCWWQVPEPFCVKGGVEQGDIPVATLFDLYFTMVFYIPSKDCNGGAYIRYFTSGNLIS